MSALDAMDDFYAQIAGCRTCARVLGARHQTSLRRALVSEHERKATTQLQHSLVLTANYVDKQPDGERIA